MLFYATLLGAAVHLDRKQPVGDQRKLLWYKVQTIRLANEKLNQPSEAASDQMILVALILLYFNVSRSFTNFGPANEIYRLEAVIKTSMRSILEEFIRCSS